MRGCEGLWQKKGESSVCGARVIVDVEWQPPRIEFQLNPRLKIVPSSHQLRYGSWGRIRCGDRSLCGRGWRGCGTGSGWCQWHVLEKWGFVNLQVVMRCGGR